MEQVEVKRKGKWDELIEKTRNDAGLTEPQRENIIAGLEVQNQLDWYEEDKKIKAAKRRRANVLVKQIAAHKQAVVDLQAELWGIVDETFGRTFQEYSVAAFNFQEHRDFRRKNEDAFTDRLPQPAKKEAD